MIDPLLILMLGLAVVLLAILRFRLPAFLALLMATVCVVWLASPEAVWQSGLADGQIVVQEIVNEGQVSPSEDNNDAAPPGSWQQFTDYHIRPASGPTTAVR